MSRTAAYSGTFTLSGNNVDTDGLVTNNSFAVKDTLVITTHSNGKQTVIDKITGTLTETWPQHPDWGTSRGTLNFTTPSATYANCDFKTSVTITFPSGSWRLQLDGSGALQKHGLSENLVIVDSTSKGSKGSLTGTGLLRAAKAATSEALGAPDAAMSLQGLDFQPSLDLGPPTVGSAESQFYVPSIDAIGLLEMGSSGAQANETPYGVVQSFLPVTSLVDLVSARSE